MATKIKDNTEQELKNTLTEKRAALSTFRFGLSGGKTKNVKEGRAIRKEIAQALTELRARKTK